ncbi:MAG: ACT domain-containing protein [Clostridia bacterium]|nr:ACT domain-containing protein [Clostridia bacterium]
MKAVITVTGRDSVGIIAAVSAYCAERDVNIQDISQSVLGEFFAMIMLTDIDKMKGSFADLADGLSAMGRARGLEIRAMHEDIFNTMHHI